METTMAETIKIEWSVRPITRYQVVRYESRSTYVASGNIAQGSSAGGSSQHGLFDNAETAYEVAYALAEADRVRHDFPLGDGRIQYPKGDPRYHLDPVRSTA